MTGSIFSTYSQGENRVTGTLIAILEQLSVYRFSRVVEQLADSEDTAILSLDNQYVLPIEPGADSESKAGSKRVKAIPDARLSSNFTIYIETKLGNAKHDTAQMQAHSRAALQKAGNDSSHFIRVVSLGKSTEDSPPPASDESIGLVGKSFDDLIGILTEVVLDDPTSSERERYLVQHFIEFLRISGLVQVDEVLIVAGRHAWKQYSNPDLNISYQGEMYGLYTCQVSRTFRETKQMGFYAVSESGGGREIADRLPLVVSSHDDLDNLPWLDDQRESEIELRKKKIEEQIEKQIISESDGARRIQHLEVVDQLMSRVREKFDFSGGETKAVLLTGVESKETESLKSAIVHNVPRVAFTYGHRYVPKDLLVDVSEHGGKTRELLRMMSSS